MPTSLNKYLDPAALDETVVNIRQIAEGLEAEMQDLPYARPDGLYPDMTVGAVQGAPQTSQWAERESTVSGSAQIESVQGATVVWNQLIKNGNFESAANWRTDGTLSVADGVCVVTGATSSYLTFKGLNQYSTTIAGHKYLFLLDAMSTNGKLTLIPTDATANGTKDFTGITTMQRVGWIWATSGGLTNSFTIRSAVTTYGTEEQVTLSIANYNCFDLTQMFGSGNEPQSVAEFEAMFPEAYYPYSAPVLKPVRIAGIESTDANGDALDGVEWETQTLRAAGSVADMLYSDHVDVSVGERAYQSGDESDATVRTDGTTTYYPLATPTTTPISPALPMTYRVQQGGTESIIVPDGEISAAPVITIAEPVNAGDEFARIWAAIESLGYTRNVAQLSRPISLTDVGSVDEVQKDTTDVADIETTKEVQE